MINFKAYLAEEHVKKNLDWRFKTSLRRTSDVHFNEAKKIIKERCSDMVEYYKDVTHEKIWRGHPSYETYVYGDSTTRLRTSKNTFNYYTLMMDNSKQWKKFPPRSKSFICSTSKTNAGSYGNISLVFPENGTKIAVCPVSDIWYVETGKYASINYYDVMQCVIKLARIAGIENLSEDNFELFQQQLDTVSKYFQKLNVSNYSKIEDRFNPLQQEWVFDNFLRKNNKDLYKTLEKSISPSRFKLYSTKTLKLDQPNNEVWFSGRAVFVSVNEIKTTVKDFVNSNFS